ncbi:uncharacterized protein LOC122262347 [Penaeus japonicus]|uniref:uncharacterized protein LOC122262347 n=1 Tax=Penaeus japonicus TaxID=27405 RepID=UPI001C70D66D|nr:uncharacterized protein LOC122262347 [Penaeus japonicus]
MATKAHALALFCILRAGQALFIDQGCIVKQEWKEEQLTWPDTHIGVWSPPGHTSIVFELTVNFENNVKSYDTLAITSQEIKLVKTRVIQQQDPLVFDFESFPGDGWREYVFSAKGDYSFTSAKDKRVILRNNDTGNYKPSSVTVVGSNVTLNCLSRARAWAVASVPVTIPLGGSEKHFLGVYSDQDISPTLTLDKERIPLTWNHSGLFVGAAGGRALPAFVQHNLTLSCSHEGKSKAVCYVETEMNNIQLNLNKFPRHLQVEGRAGNDFYLLLHQVEAESPLYACRKYAITTYVLITLLVLLVIGILVYWVLISKKKQLRERDAENPPEELRPLNPDNSQKFESDGGRSRFVTQVSEDVSLSRGRDLFQACVNTKENKNERIKEALQIYREHLDKIFSLATEGSYQTGINNYLCQYQLPGTVRDEEGKSILHYIASCKSDIKTPMWTVPDAQEFMRNYKCLPNAVDYQGSTCLHLLVDAAETSSDEVLWGGETTTPNKAWLRMAQILLELGCDPRREDGAGSRPRDIARRKSNLALAEFLEERCTAMPRNEKQATHDSILEASRNGRFQQLEEHLSLCPSLLPLDAQEDPLAEAVKSNKLKIVMLLLSAGAPLCGLPLVSVTPLQVSHRNPDLPLLLPVLMRMEYANRLRYEAQSIPEDSEDSEGSAKIKTSIEQLAADVESTGDRASWSFTKRTEEGSVEGVEARELLCLGAGFGLSLACQMLASEGLQLHPLPGEPMAVQRAYDEKQKDVLLVIFRDLCMSALPTLDELERSSLQKDFELKKIRDFCQKHKANYNTLVNQLRDACSGKHLGEIDKKILLCMSIYGLACLFRKIKPYVKDLNVIVDDLTGSTMLHVAALNNQIQMLECLLSDGADLNARTKGNLTAAHLIASVGNRGGMEYLLDYMKTQNIKMETIESGISPQDLVNGYDKLLEDFSEILLPEENALEIFSLPFAGQRVKCLLQRKFQALGISDHDSFCKFVKNLTSRPIESIEDLVKEGENLLIATSKADPRFNGKLVPQTQNINSLPVDSIQLYWEVDLQATVSYKEEGGNKYSVCVDFTNGQAFKECLKDEFQRAVRQILNNYTFSCDNLWLSYPAIEDTGSGVTVILVWFKNERTRKVRMSLTPVIKTRSELACKFITNMLYSCWWLPHGYARKHVRSLRYFGAGLYTLPYHLLMSLFLEEVCEVSPEDWESSKFLERVLSIFKRATNLNHRGYREPRRNIRLLLDPTNAELNPSKLVCTVVEFLEEISNSR